MSTASGPFTMNLTCPGTRDNKAVIKQDLDINTGGLDILRNSGTCSLFVGTLDSSDTVIDDVELAPGAQIDHYQPPAGGVIIYAVCDKSCNGTAILHYDDPDLVA
jgi:hypothetical protein